MNIQDVRLDIDKKTGVAQWVTIGQGDMGGTTIRAAIFDNDVAAALTGMSARFEMRMPNATYFEDTNCTINGNVITYVVDESHAALYAGGESVAYFALYDGETAIYSTERFYVRVARAASDGANPGHAWTNGIEEWLDDASDTLDDAVADANSRVGATINAANAAVEGMRSDVDEAISDTEEVIDRAEDAIEAMGDISELAVPLMSPDTRGGAKLEEHGGLALRDGALGIGSLVQESDGYARGGLAEVTAKGHAEQDGTPTPDNPVPIQVVRGRNLLDEGMATQDKKVDNSGNLQNDSGFAVSDYIAVEPNTDYYLQNAVPLTWWHATAVFDASKTFLRMCNFSDTSASSGRLNFGNNAAFVRVNYKKTNAGKVQLTLGSTPQPYVPYGCVGMEVRDPDIDDELISCTAIPLPQRGWVASLPDGTADTLTLDGAGKVTWELMDEVMNVDGNSTWVLGGDNYTCPLPSGGRTWLGWNTAKLCNVCATNRVSSNASSLVFDSRLASGLSDWVTKVSGKTITVLYPLATPVTEDCGYVEDWPTDIPEGATVTISELDSVGIKYFIDSSVTELAKQWYARAYTELGDAIVDLSQRVSDLEG